MLPGAALALWILLFALSWFFTARADDDLRWLAPAFFLPQFVFVAGLAGFPGRRPWPWLPFLTATILSSGVTGLNMLLLVGSVLESLQSMDGTMPAGMIVAPLVTMAASFFFFLPLRRSSRRRAAVVLLASICGGALLTLLVATSALPMAERQPAFLSGLFCRISIAMALVVIVWTVPGWIAAFTLVRADHGTGSPG
ncbi:MAG: hypothetical protein CVU59_01635 [Deltaproteobacteria bacterium HGW-Deltaproteobacteria-17]|nr:MAG: hypothetical protein CVU59_01635 [Deltaproteobacteria bacterium HGW-Deltaproteobacteria-17]